MCVNTFVLSLEKNSSALSVFSISLRKQTINQNDVYVSIIKMKKKIKKIKIKHHKSSKKEKIQCYQSWKYFHYFNYTNIVDTL